MRAMFRQAGLPLLAWCAFFVTWLFYVLAYAGRGLDNNDTGFILGISHQLSLGMSLYDEIVYVRPPVTPILHAVVFLDPFSGAPVYFDRVLTFFQIAAYSALSGMIAGRLFGWAPAYIALVSLVCFVFSANSWPGNGWHTIDGIFFSVLSIYFFTRMVDADGAVYRFLSVLCALLAAGSKQPFYMTPLLLVALNLAYCPVVRTLKVLLLQFLVAFLLLAGLLSFFGSGTHMLASIASQTSLRDLFDAGVVDYFQDLGNARARNAALPVMLVLLYFLWNPQRARASAWYVVAAAWVIVLSVGQFHYKASAWAQPYSVYDAVFVVTGAASAAMLVRSRDRSWFILLCLHAVAWASSISWGAPTTIFFAAPSVLTIAYFLAPSLDRSRVMRFMAIALVPAVLAAFAIGHRYFYSLEETVRYADNQVAMGELGAGFGLIRSTGAQYARYAELSALARRYGESSFVVLPNMPLAHMMLGQPNPIGIDWVLNAETGLQEERILARLDHSVTHAFLYKYASPAPELEGKFGSRVTLYVKARWERVAESEHFVVYRNPGNRELSCDDGRPMGDVRFVARAQGAARTNVPGSVCSLPQPAGVQVPGGSLQASSGRGAPAIWNG